MCAACFDTTLRCWLSERSDTGWVATAFPFANAGDVSAVYDTAGRLHCGFIVGIGPSTFWAAERVDTSWSAAQVYSGNPGGFYVFSNHCFEFSRDNRAWYLASYYWEITQRIWGSTMALLRCTGADWDTVWRNDHDAFHAVALAAGRDSAGFCRYAGPS
ncbi:hypothetical protein CH330_03365, partial [candidate division WOR-3 bacterium JGI_Cruoil_03_51_56]